MQPAEKAASTRERGPAESALDQRRRGSDLAVDISGNLTGPSRQSKVKPTWAVGRPGTVRLVP